MKKAYGIAELTKGNVPVLLSLADIHVANGGDPYDDDSLDGNYHLYSNKKDAEKKIKKMGKGFVIISVDIE